MSFLAIEIPCSREWKEDRANGQGSFVKCNERLMATHPLKVRAGGCEELVRRPMVITYLSCPSKVDKSIAIPAQCVTIQLLPSAQIVAIFLNGVCACGKRTSGRSVRNGVPLQSRLLIVLKPVAPKETLQ